MEKTKEELRGQYDIIQSEMKKVVRVMDGIEFVSNKKISGYWIKSTDVVPMCEKILDQQTTSQRSIIKSYEDTNDQLHKLVEELDAKVVEMDVVIKTYMESTDDYHKVIKEQAERIEKLEAALRESRTGYVHLIEYAILYGGNKTVAEILIDKIDNALTK